VECDRVHHRPGQQRRRWACEDPDGDAEGADDLEAGREVGPKVRRPRKEGEVDGDDLVGERVGVLEFIQPVVDDQQGSGDAQEQHTQLSPAPLEPFQNVQVGEIRQHAEPTRSGQGDAGGNAEERQRWLVGVRAALLRVEGKRLPPELHQVECDRVHHRPGQQRRRWACEDPDGDAEGADDLEAGREVGPKVRRPRKEGEVDGDDLVGERVGVLEFIQPVVDDQQGSDDAHGQHA